MREEPFAGDPGKEGWTASCPFPSLLYSESQDVKAAKENTPRSKREGGEWRLGDEVEKLHACSPQPGT